MEFIIIGLVTAVNIILIKMKFERGRTEDAIFDALILVAITVVFGGSFGGLVVGTISSMFISLYLFASPPTFFSGEDGLLKKFIDKAKRKNG